MYNIFLSLDFFDFFYILHKMDRKARLLFDMDDK